jgi:hypothetical protein
MKRSDTGSGTDRGAVFEMAPVWWISAAGTIGSDTPTPHRSETVLE